jgi:inosine-uridine nucleoside N-ribohydrolase
VVDIVFTCGADILAMVLNVTHQVVLSRNSTTFKGHILCAQDLCCIY